MGEKQMKYFDPNYISDELFSIVFLCGCKFSFDRDDKRRVLKEYLEKNHSINVIILEEHFNFALKKRNSKTLYYDDIFFYDLSQIETMAALFANKIYIIHESISTAAELGLFAGNSFLFPKIELIVPSIPDDPITTFINWAFFRNPEHTLSEKIEFTPNIVEGETYKRTYKNTHYAKKGKKIKKEYERVLYSKTYYKTYFNELEFIPSTQNKLNINIDASIKSIQKSIYNGFKRIKYKSSNDNSNIDYEIKKNRINVYIGTDALKIQLLSLLYDKDVREALRSEKTISEHVSYIESFYKNLTKNTITMLEPIDNKDLRIHYFIKGVENNVKLRAAIGLFLYFMQALRLIDINKNSINSQNIETKLSLKVGLNKFKSIKELIRDDTTIFDRRGII